MQEVVTLQKTNPDDMTLVEEFMSVCYQFRRNVLSNKYEMCDIPDSFDEKMEEQTTQPVLQWRPVSRESINTIVRRIRRELGEDYAKKTAVEEYIYAEETPAFDPIAEFLDTLPSWDGKDRVRELFERLPGVNEELLSYLKVWFRSAVAHWMNIDPLHGNEQVLTLIGPQGCGKSTFCAQLLPPELRTYYLDHVNVGNKFDKEMALTDNLVVNIDELDQIKPGKQPELKQLLTKHKVNGRPIFGRAQSDRRRYASFTATTNNPRPLCDPTGSRRYLCVEIPRNSIICNELPIDYQQIYAQLKYEVMDQHLPYWLSMNDISRLEQMNQKYQHVEDLEMMVNTCFRHPEAEETVKPMLASEVVNLLSKNFPDVKRSHSMNIRVGKTLQMLKYERKEFNKGTAYYIVPLNHAG